MKERYEPMKKLRAIRRAAEKPLTLVYALESIIGINYKEVAAA